MTNGRTSMAATVAGHLATAGMTLALAVLLLGWRPHPGGQIAAQVPPPPPRPQVDVQAPGRATTAPPAEPPDGATVPGEVPQADALKDLDAEERNNVVVYASVNKSVVNITTESEVQGFFGAEETSTGTGSGFVVDKQGHILTNFHVIQGADVVRATLFDGSAHPARVVGVDASNDVAVLKVEAEADKLNPVTLGDSSRVLVGQKIMAIGNPFGLERTLTTGIVSSLDRSLKAKNGRMIKGIIQTDAAINPGNSGGALIDAQGNLVGINTAIYSRSGGSLGIGFAIPVSTARQVMEQLITTGTVTRGYIGVEPQDLTAELADAFKLSRKEGVIIAGVVRGGPAAKAGIRTGDIVVSVADKTILDTTTMLNAIAQLPPGEKVAIKIVRGGQEMETSVTIGTRPKPKREIQQP